MTALMTITETLVAANVLKRRMELTDAKRQELDKAIDILRGDCDNEGRDRAMQIVRSLMVIPEGECEESVEDAAKRGFYGRGQQQSTN